MLPRVGIVPSSPMRATVRFRNRSGVATGRPQACPHMAIRDDGHRRWARTATMTGAPYRAPMGHARRWSRRRGQGTARTHAHNARRARHARRSPTREMAGQSARKGRGAEGSQGARGAQDAECDASRARRALARPTGRSSRPSRDRIDPTRPAGRSTPDSAASFSSRGGVISFSRPELFQGVAAEDRAFGPSRSRHRTPHNASPAISTRLVD